MFKLQHPQDLISRLFILEYMRDLGAQVLYDAANKTQQKNLFYKFFNDEDKESVDLNWEACMFEASIPQLSALLTKHIPAIEIIDARRNKELEKMRDEKVQEIISEPVDINLMDLARNDIEKSKNGKLKDINGFDIK